MKTWMGHLFATCPRLLPFWDRLLHAETWPAGEVSTESVVLGKMVFGSVIPRPARWSASVRVRLRVVLMKHALMI
jgi:hypothetical protein